METLPVDRYGLGRVVTGADLSKPVFDGTSTDTDDHLIDLDSPSMETDLDVRLYFWMIGNRLHPKVDSLQHTLAEAMVYDDEVVREGRLYLRDCRDRGQGFFLNKDRDFASYNQHGKPWYRMPAFGIVQDIMEQKLEPQEGEGYFCRIFEGERELTEDMDAEGIMITNIRIPVLWACFETETLRRGTPDWDVLIMGKYSTVNPLLTILYNLGRSQAVQTVFTYSEWYVDRAGLEAFKNQEWPSEGPSSP